MQSLSPAAQTALVGLPVLAYAAKDRIKELTRDWLIRRFLAFDASSEIHVGSLADADVVTDWNTAALDAIRAGAL